MRIATFLNVLLCMVVVARASADQPQAKPAIRVAIYDDAGGGGAGPGNCERCLPSIKGFETRRLSAQDIRNGQLDGFDVLVQPGGSGSKQAAALGPEGRQKIRDFVERGNGYIGICAGAYLASADYEWSLGLLDAKVLDRKHWARGNGDVEMRLTGNGQQALSAPSSVVTVYYGQGPLLAPAGKRNIPDYEELAVFETEIAENGASPGVMRGTTAAARGTFGKGRVFCFSPHPEKTAGLEPLVEAAIRWAAATGERPSN